MKNTTQPPLPPAAQPELGTGARKRPFVDYVRVFDPAGGWDA